jgi:hypothetical protein
VITAEVTTGMQMCGSFPFKSATKFYDKKE